MKKMTVFYLIMFCRITIPVFGEDNGKKRKALDSDNDKVQVYNKVHFFNYLVGLSLLTLSKETPEVTSTMSHSRGKIQFINQSFLKKFKIRIDNIEFVARKTYLIEQPTITKQPVRAIDSNILNIFSNLLEFRDRITDADYTVKTSEYTIDIRLRLKKVMPSYIV